LYGLTPKAMIESAKKNISLLEENDFQDIVVSLKASDVPKTIEAYKMFASFSDYPLHLGITEAGTDFSGTINSAVGIGSLLQQGIGDTIRVSLSTLPHNEIKVGWQILKALKLRKRGIEVTACPTCARTNIDVSGIAKQIEEKTSKIIKPLHIAVMGCAVNGPGEAKEADLGIVGGKGNNLLYKKGKIIATLKQKEIVERVLKEIDSTK